MALIIFLLLALSVAFLGWSLVRQLRKAQAAKDAGAYGDEPVAANANDVESATPTSRTRQSHAVVATSLPCPSSAVTTRATRSARTTSMSIPSRSASRSDAVISTAGSCGPPVPSVRLVESCATQTSVPPGRSDETTVRTAFRRMAAGTWK